jgi:hypothetical protein
MTTSISKDNVYEEKRKRGNDVENEGRDLREIL